MTQKNGSTHRRLGILWCLAAHRSWEELEGEAYPWRCSKCGLRMRYAEGWELH